MLQSSTFFVTFVLDKPKQKQKMKKILLSMLCVACFQTLHVQAQTKNGFRFGFGVEGALPMGALKEAPSSYKIGGGANLRFSQGIAPGFDLTLTGGAIAFIPEDLNNKTVDTKASLFIPVKLGGRLMLGKTFYLMAEAGMTLTKVYQPTAVSIGGGSSSPTVNVSEGFVNGSTFAYAPSIGMRFGGFDIGLRYEGISDVYGGKIVVLPTGTQPSSSSGGFTALRIGIDF